MLGQISYLGKFCFLRYGYLKKEVRDEVDFFHAAKHQRSWFQHFGDQSFLQGDTIIIDGHNLACSKYSK